MQTCAGWLGHNQRGWPSRVTCLTHLTVYACVTGLAPLVLLITRCLVKTSLIILATTILADLPSNAGCYRQDIGQTFLRLVSRRWQLGRSSLLMVPSFLPRPS